MGECCFSLRDLFDLANDNIQIKEIKTQGILLQGVTEVCFLLQEFMYEVCIYEKLKQEFLV